MPQSRSRSGGFTPPPAKWRRKAAATFEIANAGLALLAEVAVQ